MTTQKVPTYPCKPGAKDNLIKYQHPWVLFDQQRDCERKVRDTLSLIRQKEQEMEELKTMLKKLAARLKKQSYELENTQRRIVESEDLSRRAFVHMLKNNYANDVDALFREHQDTHSLSTLISQYTRERTQETLPIVVLHLLSQIEDFEDLILVGRLAMSSRVVYERVLRYVPPHLCRSIVYLYPLEKIYGHIEQLVTEITNNQWYNQLYCSPNSYLRVQKNDWHFHNLWEHKNWIFVLFKYWKKAFPPLPPTFPTKMCDGLLSMIARWESMMEKNNTSTIGEIK